MCVNMGFRDKLHAIFVERSRAVFVERLRRFVDAHLPQPSYDETGWSQVLPLIRLIFPRKDVERFQKYRCVLFCFFFLILNL